MRKTVKRTKAPSGETRLTLPPGRRGNFITQKYSDFSLWRYSRPITEKPKERPKEGNHPSWQLLHVTIASGRAEALVGSGGREAVIAWEQPQTRGSLRLLPHRGQGTEPFPSLHTCQHFNPPLPLYLTTQMCYLSRTVNLPANKPF